MEKIRIKNLEEDVYYEKLDNGLEVYLYTKDDIYTNYVTFTTKYGSVYNDFVPIGESKIRSFPKGIAHFLEHKVFTEKEDPQPMEFFAKSGSLCNAYTTFRNTSYLFYATKDLKENIEYLLNYVQNIYLTEEDVEKEKGIISEEIHMYEDRPGDVLFEKVRLNTLNSSPYRNSIIGTVKDIESITKEDLETCYYTFYNPSNMFIVVTGSFDPEEIMSLIRENQSKKNFKIEDNIKVKEFKEEDKVFKEKEIIKMNTNIPKIAYTLKIPLKDIKLTRRQLHLYMYVLFTTLFDETSLFDEELKKDGIINNTTYVSLLNTNTHLLISLVNETNKYEEFLERLKNKLNNMEINEKDFKRKKKVLISNEIFAYENVENINDIIPFELPDSWEWIRLSAILTSTDAGKSPQCENRPRTIGEWGVIKTTAIQDGYFIAEENKVLPLDFNLQESMVVHHGDLLITRAGPRNRTGVICVVDGEPENLILSDKTVRLSYLRNFVNPHYVMTALSSPAMQYFVVDAMTGMASSQVNISQEKMETFLLPLPPLNEQQRIVDEVSKIFGRMRR